MGVDVKGVHRTIISGHTLDLDDYMQMAGRIGRDGKQSIAVTIKYPGDTSGQATTSSMSGAQCRWAVIRTAYGHHSAGQELTLHNCCDVCAMSCNCGVGKCNEPPPKR